MQEPPKPKYQVGRCLPLGRFVDLLERFSFNGTLNTTINPKSSTLNNPITPKPEALNLGPIINPKPYKP